MDTAPKAPKPSFAPYKGAAGGWDALKSVTQHLVQQGAALKGAKTLAIMNQPTGFDCPGCAWPDRNYQSSFQFCENGAKAVAAEATDRRATPERIGALTVAQLAALSDFELEDFGRLTQPLRYDAASDRYAAISWDDAFALIASHLTSLSSPDEAAFYTSGRTSNEAAFLYQLFVREFGTNNFPDCSNMCHEASGTALKRTIGVGKGTVTLEDFTKADLIIDIGHNPGTNHPRMLAELRAAAKRGAKIMSFNPLRERGLERFQDPKDALEMATLGSTAISSHYFQPKVGGDLAALKAIAKRLLELDEVALRDGASRVLDTAFIEAHTHGFAQFAQDLQQQDYTPLLDACGLSLEEIDSAARAYAAAQRSIICWGMGITQHRYAVATIEMICALLLMRGNIGREGAGACPVRGHSNVQGDRTMGIDERPSAAFLDRLDAAFGIRAPRKPGLNTVQTIEALHCGQVKVFFAMGGNFAAATPDTELTHAALKRAALTVHVATKFNRSHVTPGRAALVLPCLGRTEIDVQRSGEQAITVEDSMSMVHLSAGRNAPASDALLSEPAIIARLAAATLPRSAVRWSWLVEDYARIREAIERVFPDFADFNARVAVPGGFRLRNTASERQWSTACGKAQFTVHALAADAPHALQAALKHSLTLCTIRSHDQYNTTVYGLRDRYRGVSGERRVLFVNAADLAERGLSAGDEVRITSHFAGQTRSIERFRLVPYDIPRGNAAAYYPETNPLVALGSYALEAFTPASKSVLITLKRYA